MWIGASSLRTLRLLGSNLDTRPSCSSAPWLSSPYRHSFALIEGYKLKSSGGVCWLRCHGHWALLGSRQDAVEAECSGAAGHWRERDVHPHTSHTQNNTLFSWWESQMGKKKQKHKCDGSAQIKEEAPQCRSSAVSISTNKTIIKDQ